MLSFRSRPGRTRLRSRLALVDLLREAYGGVLQRPGRSTLTMLGTVLGIGAFVSIIGIGQAAGGQIGKEFSVLDATQVTVTDQSAAGSTTAAFGLPDDADARVTRLNGVAAAGTWWQVPTRDAAVDARSAADHAGLVETTVFAATPGVFAAAEPTVSSGTLFNAFHDHAGQNVAVVGAAVAQQLGIGGLGNLPAIFIDGHPFTVIGIIDACVRLPQLPLGVIVPATVARRYWGPPLPANPAQMLVTTRLGAAHVVAAEVPLALDPVQPGHFPTTTAPDPVSLRRTVQGSVNSLFLVLAGVAVAIGALGIANTTLVAVLERAAEIGMRRSLGARRRDIAAQFLCEAGALGLIGGLVGAALGVVTTLSVTLWEHWSAVLDARYVIAAPICGALIGVAAGLFPAVRAAALEPAAALRR